MTHEELLINIISIVKKDSENEWIELKVNNTDPMMIGKTVSALSNSALLFNQNFAYCIWGVEDKTLNIVGTKFDPRQHKQGNQNFAKFMRRIGICEEAGTGIDKVIKEIENSKLPPPRFMNKDNSFSAIVYGYKEFKHYTKEEKILACFLHAALKYESDPKERFMTNSSLRERFQIDKSNYPMISRIISETKSTDLIKEVETHKYAPYYA